MVHNMSPESPNRRSHADNTVEAFTDAARNNGDPLSAESQEQQRASEQMIARTVLQDSQLLQAAEQSSVEEHVNQALDDLLYEKEVNARFDKPFVVLHEKFGLTSPIKRGRRSLETKLKKHEARATTLAEQHRLEVADVQTRHSPNSANTPTSMRARRLERKMLEEEFKQKKIKGELVHLGNIVAKELTDKWGDDPSRQTKGYNDLRRELASIDGLLEDRKQNRERFADLSARVQSGELSEDNEEYVSLRQYFDAVGDETDEQYRERLKNEALKNYSDWSKDKDRKEKLAGFKSTENRLLAERLNVIDKANDPSTPIDERERLLRQVSGWESPDSLVEGDSNEFREWLRNSGQKEWVNALRAADQDYQKKLQDIIQLSEELRSRKKLVKEYTDRIDRAATDEEKEALKKESADNQAKMDDLEEKINTLSKRAKEEFDKDLFDATETFHRRQRMDKLWQD